MSITLLDWRRRNAAIYAQVRAETEPAAAHAFWVEQRQRLFREHPDSADRDAQLSYAPYDVRWRFVADVDTDAEPMRLEILTATAVGVPFERFGRVTLPGIGSRDVGCLAPYAGGARLPSR